jgi:hypothetical protein
MYKSDLSHSSSPRTRLAARKVGLISPAEYTSPARKSTIPTDVQEDTDIM